MSANWALLGGLAATLFMTGLVVMVQVVHYPLFERVGADAFSAYHREHVRRMGWVAVPMAVELLTSLWLVVRPPSGSGPWLTWPGLAAAAVTWWSTARLSVPLHDQLARGFDGAAVRTLVRTNLVRTVAWVAHSALLLAMTARALR